MTQLQGPVTARFCFEHKHVTQCDAVGCLATGEVFCGGRENVVIIHFSNLTQHFSVIINAILDFLTLVTPGVNGYPMFVAKQIRFFLSETKFSSKRLFYSIILTLRRPLLAVKRGFYFPLKVKISSNLAFWYEKASAYSRKFKADFG